MISNAQFFITIMPSIIRDGLTDRDADLHFIDVPRSALMLVVRSFGYFSLCTARDNV